MATVALATLDIFFASRAWDKVYAMADIVFEEDENEFFFVVDRYLIRYDWREYLRVGIGQIHNPIVQWNRRVSHGLYLQTPITRPKFLDRELDTGIWPTHLVGVMANGSILDGRVGYFLAMSNGRGDELTRIQVGEDVDQDKGLTASLSYVPFGTVA